MIAYFYHENVGNSKAIELETTKNQVIELAMDESIAQCLHSQNSVLLLIPSLTDKDNQELHRIRRISQNLMYFLNTHNYQNDHQWNARFTFCRLFLKCILLVKIFLKNLRSICLAIKKWKIYQPITIFFSKIAQTVFKSTKFMVFLHVEHEEYRDEKR